MTTRRLLVAMLLAGGVCGLFTACSSMPQGPTYTDAELRAMCERRGGWWRGELIAGFCEFQSAALAP